MSARDMAQFDSEGQARDAYFSDSTDPGGDGSGIDSGAGWSEPEEIDVLEGNWYLLRQAQIEGDASRYFVLVGPDPDRTLAMRRGGGTIEVTEDDSFDDLPSMETEDAAREAHALWLDEWDGPTTTDDPEGNEEMEDQAGNRWTEWEVIEEAPPWFIFARTREDGEAFEIIIAGQDADGNEIYLHPGGSIDDDPYVYTDFESVEGTLAAYFEAVENGDIPEDEQPTGAAPNPDGVARSVGQPGHGSGERVNRESKSAQRILGRIVRLAIANPRIVLVVVVGAYLIHRQISPEDNPIDNALDRIREGIGGGNGVA